MTEQTRHLPPVILSILALLIAGAALIVSASFASDSSGGAAIAPTPTVPNDAMWSLGTGGEDADTPYFEWVAVYPVSSLWNILGAPSLRFTDHTSNEIGQDRSFEIGFYKYGPTWHTRNNIIEFWIGGPGSGGTLSIIGNDTSGGQLTVRNPTDSDSISLDYRNSGNAMLTVRKGPLHLFAQDGLISESKHTFVHGINILPESGLSGQVIGGAWQDGTITIQTGAVKAESLVLITPVSEPGGRWWVGTINARESFTVYSSAPDENMDFNWFILN